MIIQVQQKELQYAIEKAEKMIYINKFLPVLSSVKISATTDCIAVSVNNLNSQLTVNIPGNIDEEGSILIGKDNFKLIKKLSGLLEIRGTENNEVRILANRSVSFDSTPASEYPEYEDETYKTAFTIQEGVFKQYLKIKTFASTQEYARESLDSIAIRGQDMVSSNGATLAKIVLDIDNQCSRSIVIPIQSINELDKVLDSKSSELLQFNYAEEPDGITQLKISKTGFAYTTNIKSSLYADYSKVIPSEVKTSVVLNRKTLLDTVEFAKDIVKRIKHGPTVCISIKNNKLTFYAKGTEKRMNESIKSIVTGDDIDFIFDNRYLENTLNTIGDKNVRIEFTDRYRPAVFRGEENDNELYLVCGYPEVETRQFMEK